MKNSVYFAIWEQAGLPGPLLQLGFGFDRRGNFYRPAPRREAAGWVLNDSALPSAAGVEAALAALAGFSGILVCDFERPVHPRLCRLLEGLRGHETVVPEHYAGLPHCRVLVGPYVPVRPFLAWLGEKKARFGSVVLDGRPVGARLSPGRRAEPLPLPVVPAGRVWDAPDCLCRGWTEAADAPVVCLFDSRESLQSRCRAAECPVILLGQEAELVEE